MGKNKNYKNHGVKQKLCKSLGKTKFLEIMENMGRIKKGQKSWDFMLIRIKD